jgi:hypothetical protein
MKWNYAIFLIVFYAFVALAFLAPMSADHYIINLSDYVNHLAGIVQAKMALSEGQFPLRVAPLENFGWRYPLFQFYSPTTYTLAGLIYRWVTPANPVLAYKILVWISLVLGGIYMNRLAFWFIPSRPAAILASMVYLASPYMIIVMNNLGDLTEMTALGLLPATIYYTIRRYFNPHDIKTLLQASLCWYLLITMHVITFFYTSIFVLLFLLLVTIKNPKRWMQFSQVCIAFAFGILLAMWYFAPINLLAKYSIISQTFVNSHDFVRSHPLLSDLFFSGGAQFYGELQENHPAIGWIIMLGVGLCAYAFFDKSKIKNAYANYWLPFLLILFLLAFFVVWSPINFWQWLPHVFLIGQYSFRFLPQMMWIGALLFAWAMCWLFQDKLDRRHVVVGIVLIAFAANAWFPVNSRGRIDLASFQQNPTLTYNKNAFTLNFNKNTEFVDTIDSMQLYLLVENDILQLNKTYSLPRSLLDLAEQPSIELEGRISDEVLSHNQLLFVVNNVTMAIKDLSAGSIHWKIPLDAIIKKLPPKVSLSLQFKMNQPADIHIDHLLLAGFLKPSQVLNVHDVAPHCFIQNSATICKVEANNDAKLIELPILYYPQLLKITLNGKPVAYQSVLYREHLITGIVPEPQKMNVIEIQFQGLQWANIVSAIGWGWWVLACLLLLYRRFVRS